MYLQVPTFLSLLSTLSLHLPIATASPFSQSHQNFTTGSLNASTLTPHYDIDCVESAHVAKQPTQIGEICVNSLNTYLSSLPQVALRWSNDAALASAALGPLPIRRTFGELHGASCTISFLAADDEYGEEVLVNEVMTPGFVLQVGASAVQTCSQEEMEGMAVFGESESLMLVISGSLGILNAVNGTATS